MTKKKGTDWQAIVVISAVAVLIIVGLYLLLPPRVEVVEKEAKNDIDAEEVQAIVEKAVAKAVAEVYVTTACGCETTLREDAKKDTLLDTLPIAEIGEKKGAYGLLEGYTSVGNGYDPNEKIVGPAIFKPHSFSLHEESKDNGIYVPIGESTSIKEGSVVWRFWGDCDDIIIKGETPWWNKLFRYKE